MTPREIIKSGDVLEFSVPRDYVAQEIPRLLDLAHHKSTCSYAKTDLGRTPKEKESNYIHGGMGELCAAYAITQRGYITAPDYKVYTNDFKQSLDLKVAPKAGVQIKFDAEYGWRDDLDSHSWLIPYGPEQDPARCRDLPDDTLFGFVKLHKKRGFSWDGKCLRVLPQLDGVVYFLSKQEMVPLLKRPKSSRMADLFRAIYEFDLLLRQETPPCLRSVLG